jgi:hypothetical protein
MAKTVCHRGRLFHTYSTYGREIMTAHVMAVPVEELIMLTASSGGALVLVRCLVTTRLRRLRSMRHRELWCHLHEIGRGRGRAMASRTNEKGLRTWN